MFLEAHGPHVWHLWSIAGIAKLWPTTRCGICWSFPGTNGTFYSTEMLPKTSDSAVRGPCSQPHLCRIPADLFLGLPGAPDPRCSWSQRPLGMVVGVFCSVPGGKCCLHKGGTALSRAIWDVVLHPGDRRINSPFPGWCGSSSKPWAGYRAGILASLFQPGDWIALLVT